MNELVTLALCVIAGLCFIALVIKILLLRRIVPADMVHVVQTNKKTTSYGKNTGNGNVYYQWPKWLPVLGVAVKELPVSNFDMPLNNYEAYDKDRVPFVVDVRTFFRISDTNQAAEKIASTEELRKHLEAVVQGAVRNIMAKAKLEDIMEERSVYGQQFTDEVRDQLQEWGVVAVKNIELMDIRDSKDSNVIENIMAKKKSEIEKDSRMTVAINRKLAEEAEIEAAREIEVKQAEKERVVGEKNAEKEQMIGVAGEKAKQQIAQEAEETAKNELAVEKVRQVTNASIKIITNNVGGGVSKVMDLFSPQGGTALSGMMEAFAQTDTGKAVLAKIGLKQDNGK